MMRRFSVDFAILAMLVDGLLVAGSLKLAVLLRPQLDEIMPFLKSIPQSSISLDAWLYIAFPVMWVGVLLLFTTYDARKNFRFFDEFSSYTMGSILAAVSLAGMLYLSFRDISRGLFSGFVLIAYLSLLFVRIFYRLAYRTRLFRGIQFRRVLVVGAGVIGNKVADSIAEFNSLGLEFGGYLDDDPEKRGNPLVLGSLANARKVITAHKIDDVVLTLPSLAFPKINDLISDLHGAPVRVWVVPDYYSLALNRAQVEDFAGLPMIDLRAPALNDYQRIVKRIMDITIVVISLPFSLPLMGLIALAIRLDSPGPIVFLQQRVGENKRLFSMLKFRTMVVGAEKNRQVIESVDENGRIFQDKTKDDPRVTRVGRFLRRTSLDELPQLFNVLKGDMSIVGPRPELPYLVAQYEVWQHSRFSVPQGMTGWWQVNGRSDKPMQQNTEDDIYYVQHYSILLDLLILIKTIWVVIVRKGAY
jgi:exopolysaccharide biosynthesis polyprenyl glycosylphosphotransferase